MSKEVKNEEIVNQDMPEVEADTAEIAPVKKESFAKRGFAAAKKHPALVGVAVGAAITMVAAGVKAIICGHKDDDDDGETIQQDYYTDGGTDDDPVESVPDSYEE